MWKYYALGAAFFAALTTIFSKAGLKGMDPTLANAVRVSMVLPFAWGMAALAGGMDRVREASGREWMFLLFSAIATGLSWWCYFMALHKGEAGRVAGMDKLSLALTIVLAAAFLGESLTPKIMAGGLLVTAGAVILAWD